MELIFFVIVYGIGFRWKVINFNLMVDFWRLNKNQIQQKCQQQVEQQLIYIDQSIIHKWIQILP